MRTSDAEFFRLKAAMKDLVQRCGGQKRTADLVGLAQSMISYICTRENRAMFSPAAVLLLERECGDPVVTRASAELQGFDLVGDGASLPRLPANPYAAIADLSAEYSEVVQEFALRTADGVFSVADGTAMDRRLADIVEKAESFRLLIAKQAAGGGA